MRLLAVTILTGLVVTGCASTQSTVAGGSNSTGGSATATPSSSSSASGSSTSGAGSSSSSSGSSAASQCPAQPNEGQYNGKLAKPVPTSIEVDWVLRCSVVNAGGHRTLLVERSDSDAAALLNALRAPDEPRSSGACPLLRMLVPYFALIQADGAALEPKLPVTGCLLPQGAVIQALNKLQFVAIYKKQLS